MHLRDLKKLVQSTGDPAFALDDDGNILVLNVAAEEMLGVKAQDVMGMPCSHVLCGVDECGQSCSPACSIRQAMNSYQKIKNYDLHVKTSDGKRWCNISVLQAEVTSSTRPYSIHIIRENDMQKRLEMMMVDFVVNEAELPADRVKAVVTTTRSPSREAQLSNREKEVLRMLAKGMTTSAIAEQLHISRTTVNNHIQHILQKLNAHTRLEAIRRAEYARLI